MTATPDELGKYLYEMFEDSTFEMTPWEKLAPEGREHWTAQAQRIVRAHQYGVPWHRLRHSD